MNKKEEAGQDALIAGGKDAVEGFNKVLNEINNLYNKECKISAGINGMSQFRNKL